MSRQLSAAEKEFCAIYMSNGKNATQAYLTLHPTVKYDTARSHGCNMLKREQVKAEINRMIDETMSDKIMSKERCLEELTKIALTSTDTLKIKAIAEIGKIMGYNTQNINVNSNNETSFDNMSKDDILDIIEKLSDDSGE